MQTNKDRYPDSENKTGLAHRETSSSKTAPAYQIYLEKRRRRQTAMFTKIVIVLSGLFLVGAVLASGLIPIPFLNDFSKKVQYAVVGDVPCPVGTTPLKPENIKISVLNGTNIDKLASKAGDALKSLKFQVTKVSNADSTDYEDSALILTPAKQVDAAYTVGLAIPNSTVKISEVNQITVIIGKKNDPIISNTDFKEILKRPLSSPKSCLPVEEK